MDKILKVSGRGKIRLRPDTICAEITLQGTDEVYSEALRRAEEQLKEIKTAVASAGFAEADLKTSDFRVDTKYENVRTEKGEWTQKFVGYQYTHVLKLRFSADNARLGAFVAALAACSSDPVFSFSYTVANAEEAKEWLLREAVKDFEKKALVLAQAACVELAGIREIDYSWGEKDFSVRPVQPMRLKAAEAVPAAFSLDVTPDDIEISDTVTVTWEIA